MLSDADFAWMRANTAEVMSDHLATITIRRGSTTLPAQDVRVERLGQGSSMKVDRTHSEESRTRILVVGEVGLDIQKDDRFNWDGHLYRVLFLRPNTQVDTQAEAELIE
jgi:hypothetical protein